MSSSTPNRDNTNRHDISPIAITPLQGDFHPVSAGVRARSPSPRRKEKQPLHIRLNLTETQMDKITDAFTSKVHTSPSRIHTAGEGDGSPSRRTPRRNRTIYTSPRNKYSLASTSGSVDLADFAFSTDMPGITDARQASSLAQRRNREPPAPIYTSREQSRSRAPPIPMPMMKPAPEQVSPMGPEMFHGSGHLNDDDVSLYSQDGDVIPNPSPMYLKSKTFTGPTRGAEADKLRNDWAPLGSPFEPAPRDFTQLRQTAAHKPQRTRSNAGGVKHQSIRPLISDVNLPPPLPIPGLGVDSHNSPDFSPLELYFRSDAFFPNPRKASKQLIGQNGWLERTGGSPDKEKKATPKKTGILDGIKKIAKDMTEFSHPTRRSQQTARDAQSATANITVHPREQCLLYGELEYFLTEGLHLYISSELDRGRLVLDKLKKVADAWQQRGRPHVNGFRYDLETQLDLVELHINDFSFHGRRQGNPVEIAGLLYTMKINARAMRVRTYCQPDSVIAKQIVDAQSLLNLIGSGPEVQDQITKVAHYFRIFMDRAAAERELQIRQNRDGGRTQVPGGSRHEAQGHSRHEARRSWAAGPSHLQR
ncbi:hypothetical protein B0I35DRAFT_514476 [Stachybotrys elegans]|uniref:Uncharacterized protein n=1 Tax=Stachybotrys elegans TaxID=80388 RepID=A0A8K0WPZ6_9HYPO|nr:hypothetical protein B0I35DRAFT_514476 [Stachybotrys elegans]